MDEYEQHELLTRFITKNAVFTNVSPMHWRLEVDAFLTHSGLTSMEFDLWYPAVRNWCKENNTKFVITQDAKGQVRFVELFSWFCKKRMTANIKEEPAVKLGKVRSK